MTSCTEKTTTEIYSEIEAKIGDLPAKPNNSLVTVLRNFVHKKIYPHLPSTYGFDLYGGLSFKDIFVARNKEFSNIFLENPEALDNRENFVKAIQSLELTEGFANSLWRMFYDFNKTFTKHVDLEGSLIGEDVSLTETPLGLFIANSPIEDSSSIHKLVPFFAMIHGYSAIAQNPPGVPLARSQIATLLYGDGKARLSAKEASAFKNVGKSRPLYAEQIGFAILRSLNIKASPQNLNTNDNILKATTRSIEKSLASNLGLAALVVMEQRGTIKANNIKLDLGDHVTGRNYQAGDNYFSYTDPLKAHKAEADKITKFFRNHAKRLEKITSGISNKMAISETPITTVPTPVKGALGKLPSKLKEGIKLLQSIAHTSDEATEVVLQLDKKVILGLEGYVDTATTLIFEEDADAVESKNRDLERNLDTLREYSEVTREDGTSLLKKFYMPFSLMKTHRIMDGIGITLQNSKLHRHLFFPESQRDTEVTLDNLDLFKAAVAQAFGKDIDKTNLPGAVTMFDEVMASDLVQEAVDAYLFTQQGNDKDTAAGINELNRLLPLIQKEVGGSSSIVVGLKAISEYRLANGRDFTTNITLEVDGITNGFAFSVLQYAMAIVEGDTLTEEGKRRLNQIGITLANQDGDYGTRSQVKVPDAYQELGLVLASIFKELEDPSVTSNVEQSIVQKLENSRDSTNNTARKTLITNFLDNIGEAAKNLQSIGYDLSDATSSAVRKMAKSPFMVFNYAAGINSISKEMTKDIVEQFKGKVVKAQTDYNNATTDSERAAIVSNTQELITAFEFFNTGKPTTNLVSRVEGALKKGTLHKMQYESKAINVEFTISSYMQGVMQEAFGKLLGTNKRVSDAITDVAEVQFLIFKRELDKAAYTKLKNYFEGIISLSDNEASPKLKDFAQKKLNSLVNPNGEYNSERILNSFTFEQLKELVKEANLTEVLPHFVGALMDPANKQEFLEIISTAKGESNKKVTVPVKGQRKYSTTLSSVNYVSPGASAVVNLIHNADSATLIETLLTDGIDGNVYPIHDAMMTSIALAGLAETAYNNNFLRINEENNLFKAMVDNLRAALDNMPQEEKDKLAQIYLEKAFKNQNAKDKTSIEETLNNVLYLEAANTKAREVLFKELNKEHTKVQQMYLPKDTAKLDSQKVPTRDGNILYSSAAKLQAAIRSVFTNQNLAEKAGIIFSELQKLPNTTYVSDEAKQAEEEHLRGILENVVLKVLDNIQGVSVSAEIVKGRAAGGYKPNTKEIILQLNQAQPVTYAEQTKLEVFVHEALHPIIRLMVETNDPLMDQFISAKNEIVEKLTVEDFLHKDAEGNVIFLTDETLERQQAQEMFDHATGSVEEFAVYALTNKFLVKRLKEMRSTPRTQWWAGERIPEKILNFILTLVDRFLRRFNESVLPKTEYDRIFNMVEKVNMIHDKAKPNVAESMIKQAREKAWNASTGMYHNTMNKLNKTGNSFIPNAAVVLAGLPTALQLAETQQAFTKAYYALTKSEKSQLLAQLVKAGTVGTTSIAVEKMLALTKHLVDSQRKHREQSVITSIREAFKNPELMTSDNMKSLTKVMLFTDISSLSDYGLSATQIKNLLQNPDLLQNKIFDLETSLGVHNNNYLKVKLKGLAEYIATGVNPVSNSYLNVSNIMRANAQQSDTPVNKVNLANADALTTLYALRFIPEEHIKRTASVMEQELASDLDKNGITFILGHHKAFKQRSLSHLFDDKVALMQKGYSAWITDPYIDIRVAPVSQEDALSKEGYTKVKDVKDIEGIYLSEGQSLYVNRNYVEPNRTSGIISWTEKKASGTTLFEILAKDPNYQKVDSITGTLVADGKAINRQIKRITAMQRRDEAAQIKSGLVGVTAKLIPLRNAQNKIIDYRVTSSHALKEQYLDPTMEIDQVLGRMEMQYSDKVQSQKVNENAFEYLAADYNRNYEHNRDGYVDIMQGKFYDEIYSVLPAEWKRLIDKNAMSVIDSSGNLTRSFPVLRDNLNVFFGHKQMTTANMGWIAHAIPKRYQAQVKHGLQIAGRLWADTVSQGVVNVIIKNTAVPAANLTSNFIQSLSWGMTPLQVGKSWAAGWRALETYKRQARQLNKLYYEQLANPSLRQDKEFMGKYQRLQQDLKENTASELMDLGLFTSIAEEIELQEYDYFSRVRKYLDKKTGKAVPDIIKKTGSVLYISENTRAFQELRHFTQSMDFVARYGLYNHLITKRKMDKIEAQRAIFDSFVMYDIPLDKRIEWANKSGWFLYVKYWLGIQKALYRTTQKNPGNVAFMLAAQEITGIDAPDIFDSAILLGDGLPPLGGPAKVLSEVINLPTLDMFEAGTGLALDPTDILK